jgi:hypothetical protein
MILDLGHIDQYLEVYFADAAEDTQLKKKKYKEKFKQNSENEFIFYKINSDKKRLISIVVRPDLETTFIMFLTACKGFDSTPDELHDEMSELLSEITSFLHSNNKPFELEIRTKPDGRFSKALVEQGFNRIHVRHEYKIDLEADMFVNASDMKFYPFQSLNLSLQEVADLLAETAKDSPNHDVTDNPLEIVQSYLTDDELYSEPDCIQIGVVNGEPAAILIPQSEDTWGTLSFMGIVPRYRGKGYGVIVQQHGMSCLYKQGARLYHGGTQDSNTAMQAVFEKNQCQMFKKLEVWIYNSKQLEK